MPYTEKHRKAGWTKKEYLAELKALKKAAAEEKKRNVKGLKPKSSSYYEKKYRRGKTSGQRSHRKAGRGGWV